MLVKTGTGMVESNRKRKGWYLNTTKTISFNIFTLLPSGVDEENYTVATYISFEADVYKKINNL